MKGNRAVTVEQLLKTKRKTIDFTGDWLASFGCPEIKGGWIIWGSSFSGKTTIALKLAKYLAIDHNLNVLYNSLEEGDSQSFTEACVRCGMMAVPAGRFKMINESIKDLRIRLRKQRAADVIIIDSVQYTCMKYADWQSLRDEFKSKLFIFISHADGKQPNGRVAKSLRYDAFVKIHAEGYTGFVQSRYGGGEDFLIWPEGAAKYWGKIK